MWLLDIGWRRSSRFDLRCRLFRFDPDFSFDLDMLWYSKEFKEIECTDKSTLERDKCDRNI